MTLSYPFFDAHALLGGILIGAASALLFVANGRIAGISGIVGRLVGSLLPFPGNLRATFAAGEGMWRLVFLAGLVAGGLTLGAWSPEFSTPRGTSAPWLLIAGLLVGTGTRIGWGCTSGHGVCGIGRFSPLSIYATLIFMVAGFATVALVRILGLSI